MRRPGTHRGAAFLPTETGLTCRKSALEAGKSPATFVPFGVGEMSGERRRWSSESRAGFGAGFADALHGCLRSIRFGNRSGDDFRGVTTIPIPAAGNNIATWAPGWDMIFNNVSLALAGGHLPPIARSRMAGRPPNQTMGMPIPISNRPPTNGQADAEIAINTRLIIDHARVIIRNVEIIRVRRLDFNVPIVAGHCFLGSARKIAKALGLGA